VLEEALDLQGAGSSEQALDLQSGGGFGGDRD
jgi:hypothetical protein